MVTIQIRCKEWEAIARLKAFDYWRALYDIDLHLRSEVKYKGNDAAQEIRDKFWEILTEKNITLEEWE